MVLKESASWLAAHGETVDVNDTLAGKLLGASRTMAMSRFLESHPAVVVLLRLLFYVQVGLILPWFTHVVPDTPFLALCPFSVVYAVYLYMMAPLTTLRALLTSFDVLYVLIVGTCGLIALCDILLWSATRTFFILAILLPCGIGIGVLFDALAPEAERLAGSRGVKTASFVGALLFTSIPVCFFFDLVPDVQVNEYKLAEVGGREVSFSTFSVMASSLTTIALFCLRWGVSAVRHPDSFLVLRGPMLKQAPFNNKATAIGASTEDLENQTN